MGLWGSLATEEIRLSPEAFRGLRDLIYERSGIHFPNNKAYLLESRLIGMVKERSYESFDDYLLALKGSPGGEEADRLFSAITINETSFFRDMEQLDVIHNGMLHGLMEEKRKKGVRRLKLWSTACSSGEEPYTMAIYQIEAGLPLMGWDIEILGSDISEAALATARMGIYGSYALKSTPERYLKRYFSSNGDGMHSVRSVVRQLVRFDKINLYDLDKRLRLIGDIDIILCRNVLIYFDDNAKRKVLSALYDSLSPGGYLVIGRSESIHNLTRAFRPVVMEKMVFYRKV